MPPHPRGEAQRISHLNQALLVMQVRMFAFHRIPLVSYVFFLTTHIFCDGLNPIYASTIIMGVAQPILLAAGIHRPQRD